MSDLTLPMIACYVAGPATDLDLARTEAEAPAFRGKAFGELAG
ncbi:hypothetical protein [Novosphingobium naphthalenivorans]|nr:hypothetical protein [Novosphingobium naphthalenivorans]